MATVSRTGFGKSASVDAHYLYFGTYFGENKPHAHKNKNGVKVRNRGITAINCHKGYRKTCHDFKYWLNQDPRLKKHSINLSLNFGKDLDYSNPHDVNIGLKLTRKWVKKCFGKHCVALVVAQDDNTHKESHCQACVLNIDTRTLKKMPSSTYNLTHLRRCNDAIMNAYNAQNANQAGNRIQPRIHIQWGANRRKNSTKDKYVIHLANLIWKVATNKKITKRSKFRKILKKKYHIRFKAFRPGKRHKHYGVSFGYNGKPSVKASQLRKVHKYISYFGLKKQFKLNKQALKQIKKRARSKSLASSSAFNDYSTDISMYYTNISTNTALDKQDYSSEVSSAEDRFGLSADDVINSAKSSSSASEVYSTTSSAKSIMAYVHAMDKNPFGSNEFFSSSTVSSAEDQIAFHPIPSSVSSSASTSSSATPASSSSNSIASANNSAFDKASSASSKAKERKIKHEKEVKQSRINQEAIRLDRQTERYHQQSESYYQQIPQSDKDISSSSRAIRFGSRVITWFHAKVSHTIDYFINKAKAKFQKIIIRHKQKKIRRETQKDRGGLD